MSDTVKIALITAAFTAVPLLLAQVFQFILQWRTKKELVAQTKTLDAQDVKLAELAVESGKTHDLVNSKSDLLAAKNDLHFEKLRAEIVRLNENGETPSAADAPDAPVTLDGGEVSTGENPGSP